MMTRNLHPATISCRGCGAELPHMCREDVDYEPSEALRLSVVLATAAIDAAHKAGQVIPPQAAGAVAMLDLVAQSLAAASRDHTVTENPVT
jgi:hypothetical protein